MPSQNFVIGNKTKIRFTVMPDSLIDNPAAPADVTITTSGSASSNATTIPVNALSGPVPAGTPLKFTKSGQPDVIAYTTASAATGATSLIVEALSGAIATASSATYTALLLLVGGTTSDENIQSNDQEVTIYGDDLGFSTGRVTAATWQVTYGFNVLPSDPGYFRIAWAARNAVNGALGWLKKEDQAPSGFTNGESISGLVAVTDFSKTAPSDGIITGSVTFKGRGAPTIAHYS